MACKKCKSDNITKDNSLGVYLCSNCGVISDDFDVVNELGFDNQAVQGTFVHNNMVGFNFGKNKNTLSLMIDSSKLRLTKVYKIIQQVASRLGIGPYHVEMARKYYNIASNKKFTQGRRTGQVVGAILYLVCRMQSTRHLLIDFSEVLQINLFVLGSTYLKFIRLLKIIVPIVDPSLFIHRYCGKLEFAEKAKAVGNNALKILQCMDRDWMVTGRRPSGLCGAAILISARMNGFKRTTGEITKVVHVCDETIKKRLKEFSKTKVAMMTKKEFDEFDVTKFYPSSDPPAFTRNRDKEKERNSNTVEDLKQIEKIFEGEVVPQEGETKESNQIEGTSQQPPINDADAKEMFEDAKFFLTQAVIAEKEPDAFSQNQYNNSDDELNDEGMTNLEGRENEEMLSMLEDKDVSRYIHTNDEYNIKKTIWNVMFQEWREEQKEKQIEKDLNKKPPRVRKTSRASRLSENQVKNKTPFEAIKNSDKFGRRLNLNKVKRLFPTK